MKEEIRIVAAMIVKNEEVMLERCLKSIKNVVDDIVIVDTGSTDKTIEIAKKYTDKVYFGDEYLWQDDFSFHRNQSLEKCELNDWILVIDADEFLDKSVKRKDLIEFIEKNKDKKAILFKTISVLKKQTFNKQVRLFQNTGEIEWKGAAHNYLNSLSEDTVDSEFILFYDYSPSHKKDPDRTFRILKEYCEQNPDCVRERYYLAREYYFRKDAKNALIHFNLYSEIAVDPAELADAYMLSAYCYFNLGQFKSAITCAVKAIINNPDFKEPFILMSKISGSEFTNKKWLEFSRLCKNENVLFVRDSIFADDNKVEKGPEYYNNIYYNYDYNTDRYDEIYKFVMEHIETYMLLIKRKIKVLDIGCGLGSILNCLSPNDEMINYIGFDFSEAAIQTAKEKFKDYKNINFYIGDAYDRNNYKENIDYFILTEVLEHVDDFKVLENIPSGKHIIFSVPSFDDAAHLRTYKNDKEIIKRYKDVINIEEHNIHYFEYNKEQNKWELIAKANRNPKKDCIFLVKGVKI